MTAPSLLRTTGRRALWAAACTAAAVLAGIADARWGDRFSLRLFVFLPVLAAALYGGPSAPILAGLAGALAWSVAVRRLAPAGWSNAELAWETGTRFVMWVLPAVAVARCRRAASRERLQAGIDPLTGLFNRRGFLDQFPATLAECVRDRRPITVAYFDADGFKRVNDTLGHARGDAVLSAAADTFRSNTRRGDLVGRMGGDEFVLVLPGMTADAARAFILRMQTALRTAMNAVVDDMTFCAGVATFTAPADDPDALLQVADRLMYEAKTAGRGESRFCAIPAA